MSSLKKQLEDKKAAAVDLTWIETSQPNLSEKTISLSRSEGVGGSPWSQTSALSS